eukprot:11223684-Alexandrium_andersonii.AAC.1
MRVGLVAGVRHVCPRHLLNCLLVSLCPGPWGSRVRTRGPAPRGPAVGAQHAPAEPVEPKRARGPAIPPTQ